MKKINAVGAYNILNGAKLTKMADTDKYTVIKIMREIKPITVEITEALEVAREKLKSDNHATLQERVQRWNELSESEKVEINSYFNKYNASVDEAMKELTEEDFELKNHLCEESFASLIASNDFDVATIMSLEEVIVE